MDDVLLTMVRHGERFTERHPTLLDAVGSADVQVEHNLAAPESLECPSLLLVGPRRVRFDAAQVYVLLRLAREVKDDA